MVETIFINLITPFIALVLLSTLIDRATLALEGLMHKVPKLPDHFEWWVAYLFVLGAGYFICYELDFTMFKYLGLEAKHEELDWLLTALIISGGSTFVRTQFGIINEIPAFLSGITTSISKVIKKR